jgi:Fe-S-cluster-containing hydrogenase component 2
MKKAFINASRCDQSPFCPVKRVCPVGAVTQEAGFMRASTPVINEDKCTGCGLCVRYCPMGAVTMK